MSSIIIYIDTQRDGERERTDIETERMDEFTHSHFLSVILVLWSKIATDTKLLREKLQRGYHNVRKARLEESGGAHTPLWWIHAVSLVYLE